MSQHFTDMRQSAVSEILLHVLIPVSTQICFASAKSSVPCFPHNNSLPEIKSACFEKEGMLRGVEGSTLHYITAHQYLTVGIICKYFIKLHISSSPVPQGPTSGKIYIS